MDNPNYYAIIPANVRYCDDICANAKLLYGEITALCNTKGYCYASNKYFAELYKLKRPQTISDWVKQLEKNRFISVELVYQGKEIAQRLIRIAPAETLEVQRKNVVPNNEKTLQGTTKKRCDNNTRKNNKEEYIQTVPQQVEGIYIFLSDFEKACTDYFDAGCAVRNTKKGDSLEQCYTHLINNAIAGAGLPKLDAKTIKAYNPSKVEIEAVKSEIKKFSEGLQFYKLEKERFEQGSTGFYAPKLIKSILIKNEYAKKVSEKASGVTPAPTNSGQHQQDPPKDSFAQSCADLLGLHSKDAVQIAHRIALALKLPKDEIIIRAVEGFANWGRKENIVITNHENIGEVVHQFCQFIKEKNGIK